MTRRYVFGDVALARRWAERVIQKSSRSYDMWLEPFLGEEAEPATT